MLSACGFWLFRRRSMSWYSQVSRSLLWLLSRFVFVLVSLFRNSFSKGLIYFSWVAYVVDECMFLPRFKSVARFRLWFSYSPQKRAVNYLWVAISDQQMQDVLVIDSSNCNWVSEQFLTQNVWWTGMFMKMLLPTTLPQAAV